MAQQLRLSGLVACSRTDSDLVELRRARAADASQQAMREDPMNYLVTYLKSFVRKDEGQDLLEYALLVALIAIVAIGAVTLAGTEVDAIFDQIAADI
ncbi:MAG TPA: hypothetical protein VH701_14505 [Vicinamibacterales bacterium]